MKTTASPSCEADTAAIRCLTSDANLGSIAAIVTFAISLGIYLKTVSPSIAGGDAGELVAEGCTLGTAHPPGYPLYMILVYAVTQLGRFLCDSSTRACYSPAFYVNVMSCGFGAAASGLIAKAVFELSNHVLLLPQKHHVRVKTEAAVTQHQEIMGAIAGTTVGLLHSFSPLAWQYSVTAEVFSLHNLFVALLLNLAIYFATRKTETSVYVGAYICGLALTNQHTSILFEVPLIIWVVCATRMLKDLRFLLKTAVCFVFGLTVYLVLPFFALTRPHAGSWGDVTNFSGFWHHFSRKDYGTLQLYSGDDAGAEGLVERTLIWLGDFILIQSGNHGIVGFALYGGYLLCAPFHGRVPTARRLFARKQEWDTSNIGLMLVTSLAFYVLVFFTLANLPLSNKLLYGIHQRFWMHPNIFLFVFAGVGLSRFLCHAAFYRSRFMRVSLVGLMVVTVARAYHRSLPISDQSNNTFFRSYARGILDPLPKNALLLINYDQQWTSVRYMQECEGFRKDVTSINMSMMSYPWWKTKHSLYPDVEFPGTHYTMENTRPWLEGGFTFTELVEANYDLRSGGIFVGGQLSYPDTAFTASYTEVPYGMTRRFVNKSVQSIKDAETYRKHSLYAWKKIAKHYYASGLPDETKYSEETWEFTINREFFNHLVIRATHLLDLAVSPPTEEPPDTPVLQSLVDAAAWMEIVSALDVESIRPALKKNLGLAYMHMVRNKELGNEPLPTFDDVFAEAGWNITKVLDGKWWTDSHGRDWKSWASTRWSETWGEFLSMPGAKDDPSYHQVKKIFETVMNKTRGR